MDSTQRRMVGVAVAVCAFAVGMAGLLNYFKYRSTAGRIIEQRLTFTGKSIESSILSSLSLGLQFADLATLPAMMERERATDDLILGIDVFDADGRPLYSTDRLRGNRAAPAAWVAAARKAGNHNWVVHDDEESAVGIAIQNNFGLTIGHLALRYSDERVRAAAQAVARDLAVNSAVLFGVSASLASLALVAVMRRQAHDMLRVEGALRNDGPSRGSGVAGLGGMGGIGGIGGGRSGPFRTALQSFGETVHEAEAELTAARLELQRGAAP